MCPTNSNTHTKCGSKRRGGPYAGNVSYAIIDPHAYRNTPTYPRPQRNRLPHADFISDHYPNNHTYPNH
jgi:hypothetical protein